MKKTLTILTIFFAAAAAVAREKADIIVSYDVHTPDFEKGKSEHIYHCTLLANCNVSKFYSPRVEHHDSLKSTPQGRDVYNNMIMAAILGGDTQAVPGSDESQYIMKNKDATMTVYETHRENKYRYEESPMDWKWQIADSTKVILGYECIKATTNFHGRDWTVWFSPEIPLQTGPWKLCGLPGMIMEAWCDGNQYGFYATGIEKTNKSIKGVYLSKDYEKITREDFLRIKRKYIDNPMGNLKSQHGSTPVLFIGSNGSVSQSIEYLPRNEVDFIETDY